MTCPRARQPPQAVAQTSDGTLRHTDNTARRLGVGGFMEASDATGWLCRWQLVARGHLRAPTSSTTWRETAREAGRKQERRVSRAGARVHARRVLTRHRHGGPGAVTSEDDPQGSSPLHSRGLPRSRGRWDCGRSWVLEAGSPLGLRRAPSGGPHTHWGTGRRPGAREPDKWARTQPVPPPAGQCVVPGEARAGRGRDAKARLHHGQGVPGVRACVDCALSHARACK